MSKSFKNVFFLFNNKYYLTLYPLLLAYYN